MHPHDGVLRLIFNVQATAELNVNWGFTAGKGRGGTQTRQPGWGWGNKFELLAWRSHSEDTPLELVLSKLKIVCP